MVGQTASKLRQVGSVTATPVSGHMLMYYWLCVYISCTAHALHTAAGRTLDRDFWVRLHYEFSYRHTRLSSTYFSSGRFGALRMLRKQELTMLMWSTVCVNK
jgi:hypothetical protein